MPLVSVIVPVYNTEKYLRRCIDSILAQTFTDFELLLIDDGSTDNSGAICDEYITKDYRIVVIHQENLGVLAARVAGIRAAKGELLYFVDSDDSIQPDALESMALYMDDATDIVCFESCVNGELDLTGYAKVLMNYMLWNVWGKLYRRELFDDYVMNITRYFKVGEDFLTNLRILANLKGSIKCCSIKKYNYSVLTPTSVQIGHKSTGEYEKKMYLEVTKCFEMLKPSEQLKEILFRWQLGWVSGMMGYRYVIDYSEDWIQSLRMECDNYQLSLREKLTAAAIKISFFRGILILERKVKDCMRRWLNQARKFFA